jgi:hypothetical protein
MSDLSSPVLSRAFSDRSNMQELDRGGKHELVLVEKNRGRLALPGSEPLLS